MASLVYDQPQHPPTASPFAFQPGVSLTSPITPPTAPTSLKTLGGTQPAVTNPFAATAPAAPTAVTPNPLATPASVLAGGLNGAPAPAASYDAPSAAVNIGEGVLSGAISGAMVGGVPGAAAGAAIGLVASGLNAWLGVRSARKQARDQQAILTAAQAKQDARDKQARDDALGQEGYNRDQARKAQLYTVYKDQMAKMGSLVQNSDELKNAWVQNGWASNRAAA